MGSDVRPDECCDESVERVAVLRAALLPRADDEADNIWRYQLLWKKWEHREAPFCFQRQPVCLGPLTCSSSEAVITGVALVRTFSA